MSTEEYFTFNEVTTTLHKARDIGLHNLEDREKDIIQFSLESLERKMRIECIVACRVVISDPIDPNP